MTAPSQAYLFSMQKLKEAGDFEAVIEKHIREVCSSICLTILSVCAEQKCHINRKSTVLLAWRHIFDLTNFG